MRIEPEKDFGQRSCPSCACDVPANHNRCPLCGYEFPNPTSVQKWVKMGGALLMLAILGLLLLGLLR